EIMWSVAIELDGITKIDNGSINTCTNESVASKSFELELQLSFARACDRREHAEPRAIGQREDPINDLLHGLRFDLFSAIRAMRHAHTCEEKTQVIRNLGDGANRGTRRLGQWPLFDGDCRREPLDAIDIRLGKLLEKLPRVRRERLNVSTLALGINRVEGER